MKQREVRAMGAAIGALAVGLASSTGSGRQLDHRLFHAINGFDRGGRGAIDGLMKGVTELGSIWGSVGAAAALAAAGHRRGAGRALGAAGATWLLGQGLKRVFRRPRPYDSFEPEASRLLIARPRGTSWPSSHPAVLMAFVTVAARELGLGPGGTLACAALAKLVGLSRISLGVHFPSDVVGGLLLGWAVGSAWPSEAPGRR